MKPLLHFVGLAFVVVGAGALANWPGVAIALGAYALAVTMFAEALDRLRPAAPPAPPDPPAGN